MLKHTLKLRDKIDINGFHHLTAKLKNDSNWYQYNKANVFGVNAIETFLRDAPYDIYLAIKVSICTVI